MSTDRTQQQSTEELRHAQELSLQAADPPATVAGYDAKQLLGRGAFGEVWVVLAQRLDEELRAEEAKREDPRPILLAADLARLRGKPPEAIRAALEVLRTFPGARVVEQ